MECVPELGNTLFRYARDNARAVVLVTLLCETLRHPGEVRAHFKFVRNELDF